MKRLLIVWHSRTGCARQMSEALTQGARAAATALDLGLALEVRSLAAAEAHAQDVLDADGYLFCAPENLGSLTGTMKEFFDQAYYAVLDQVAGRPCGLAIAAGSDGAGAQRQMERICTGWRLNLIGAPVVVRNGAQTAEQILAPKTLRSADADRCHELGGLVAATLLLGEENEA